MLDLKIKLAFMKALYESDSDFISMYAYFALQCVEGKDNFQSVQRKMKTNFDINVTDDILTTLLKKLKKKFFIEYYNKTIVLTTQGNLELSRLRAEISKSERESNSLISDIHSYIKSKFNKEYDIEQINIDLTDHLREKISTQSIKLNSKLNSERLELRKYIIDFIIHTEKNDNINFEKLRALSYGMILNSVLINDPRDLNEIEKKFEDIMVYLDTNIIFSLLGYHPRMLAKPAQELMKLLKKFGIPVKIFKFTVDEVCLVLRNYDPNRYSQYVKVASVYSEMKMKGLTYNDIKNIISSIEKKLNEIGITVEYNYKVIDPKKSSGWFEKIRKYKPLKNENSIKHDIQAILNVKDKRSIKKVNIFIEDCKCLFLSEDIRLFLFDYNELGHTQSATYSIPEVILRDRFSNMLWLKDPDLNSDLPISNLIAGYVKNVLVSNEMWDIYVTELEKLKSQSKIQESDINLLFSSNELEKLLLKLDSEIDRKIKIEQIKIFNDTEIIKIRKEREEDKLTIKRQESTLKEVKNTFISQDDILKEKDHRINLEKQKNIELNDHLKNIASNVSRSIEKKYHFWKGCIVLILLIIINYFWAKHFFLLDDSELNRQSALVGLILPMLTFIILIIKIAFKVDIKFLSKYETKFIDWLITKKMRKFNINNLFED